ncbi:MAG TPA: CBS domain-containing protein [Streptosporangiaceae bacterium]
MTIKVVTVTDNMPFKEVVRTLADHGVGGAPVVDAEDRLVGVVSETDLLRKQEDKGVQGTPVGFLHRRLRRNPHARAGGVTAWQIMSAPAVTVSPETPVVEAARLLSRHKINRLPVVDSDGTLVGIVSRGDLLGVFLQPDEEIRDEVVHDVIVRALAEDRSRVHVAVHDGVVTLRGQLELKSLIPIAVALTGAVDGVVGVDDDLTYRIDDTHPAPYPRA